MVKISRRDALKVGAVGVLGGLTFLSPIANSVLRPTPTPKKKKKRRNNKMNIQWIAQTSGLYYQALSTYTEDFEALWDGLEPITRVVCVSIFGAATVTNLRGTYSAPQEWRDLSFVRADTNGSYRTEIWYLNNTLPGTYTFEPTFSGSVDSTLGVSSYIWFGGIGTKNGATGTGTPASNALTPLQINSMILSTLAVQSTTGVLSAESQNKRWERSGALGTGIGADKGPINPIAFTTLQFDGITVAHAWAQSSVELLSYQDNPPIISGM